MLKLSRRHRNTRACTYRPVTRRKFADDTKSSKDQKSFNVLDYLSSLLAKPPTTPPVTTPSKKEAGTDNLVSNFQPPTIDSPEQTLPPPPPPPPPVFDTVLTDALTKSLDESENQDTPPFDKEADAQLDEDEVDIVFNRLQANRNLDFHDGPAPGLGDKELDMDIEDYAKALPKTPDISEISGVRSANEEVDHRRKEMRKALKVQRQNFKRDLKTLEQLKGRSD